MEPCLKQVFPKAKCLERLSLKRCGQAGIKTMLAAVELLTLADHLRHLDLSHVSLSANIHVPLCAAISAHSYLETLSLADTGLGSTGISNQCISNIFGSTQLRSVDIGWNPFTTEVFLNMGKEMARNSVMQTLLIPNCSGYNATGDTSLSVFLEHMAYDSSLTHLDISMNRIDSRAALILEDSLERHRRLTHLNLSQNPCGMSGIRSVLRLLSLDQGALIHVSMEDTYSGVAGQSDVVTQTFHASSPGGKYKLDLEQPFCRSVLRMLYKTCERLSVAPEQAFSHISYTCRSTTSNQATRMSYKHASKDQKGVWAVPTSGLLIITFTTDKALESVAQNLADSDFEGVLDRYYSAMRWQPGWKKAAPMFARWMDLNGRNEEQRVFLGALAQDFSLSLPRIELMCQSSWISKEIVAQLLPSCTGGRSAVYRATQTLFRSLGDFVNTQRTIKGFLEFNAASPTGHYYMDLGNPSDRAMAERLFLLDRWEAVVDRRHKRPDTTATGNASHFRNEMLSGKVILGELKSLAEWMLPEAGYLEVDYLSNVRAPRGSEALNDLLWGSVLQVMFDSPCSADDEIGTLRSLAHLFYLTSLQIRQLVGVYKKDSQRADALVTLFNRITDMENSKLFRVRLGNNLLTKLCNRLGFPAFFPFYQPENFHFDFDLAHNDQRMCAFLVVNLAVKEKVSNIMDPRTMDSEGHWQFFPQGLPTNWADKNKVPRMGRFSGTYMCAPEYRKFEVRKKLGDTYGYFNVSAKDADVTWCTGLNEPPPDVIKLLEFLLSQFKDPSAAYIALGGGDGPDGQGCVTHGEFESALVDLKCNKFKGPDERKRLNDVFWYMDPGREGSISREEFYLMDQLWKEVDLTLRELTQHLCLTFAGDLSLAWKWLTHHGFPDEKEELTKDDFARGTKQAGYFGSPGSSQAVFGVLDWSEDGLISEDEFQVLEAYKPALAGREGLFTAAGCTSLGTSPTSSALGISFKRTPSEPTSPKHDSPTSPPKPPPTALGTVRPGQK
jgi:hypothetical protein